MDKTEPEPQSDQPGTSKQQTNVSESVSPVKIIKSRQDRLKELKLRRNEARKLNRAEVVEEDRRSKLPKNWENRKKRAEWELEEIQKRKECEAAGEEYGRVKLLTVSAIDAERKDMAKRKKKDPDIGFSNFEDATIRQNRRLTKQIRPNHEEYERQREELGDECFYADMNTMLQGKIKDTPEAINRMVEDLEMQREKRKKFHRRRFFNPDKDVDYINETNAKFNQKAERFYGKYTAEIKQNLERGTAV